MNRTKRGGGDKTENLVFFHDIKLNEPRQVSWGGIDGKKGE